MESDIRILAEGLMFPEGPVAMADGSVVLVEIERETISRVSVDGSVSVVAETGGGPNGLAVGPDGAFYICNNGGFLFRTVAGLNRTRPGIHPGYTSGRIERFDPRTGTLTTLYERCGDHPLCGPNDIVFDHEGGFYFTDFGKNRLRDRDHAGLYYARADGSMIVEVAYPLTTANGVGLSPDDRVVYVAETETARLWAFDLEEPGRARKHPYPSPHGGRLVCGLPGYQRFDSLAVDAAGNICVATLVTGCITVVAPTGEVMRQVMVPDGMVTNICFGGADMKTAYVTMSGTGRLGVLSWPEPGLRLAYS
ncbi:MULTISPECIES: SMP-30/gluconolactonase/LRE family protein [Caballeronia]|jgi:gluconolactonase|uniref:Gluconolaconase n=1 Tax=Caballeronia zhejiangensis TaxID=871203 RepID=A0A656QWN5_9BURK|nr:MULTISPECIES: SMP-30/gluconolactonase/LRE family protein [Caballeronia]EKS70954.1 gluconolactonase [Burkholderia sp. SJ98]KDR33982.1 gluconolaconase [Caballeronia zhejiangensis]MDR5788860.1 SMP-30/gluconolactonase/LRE family protein [Caballeronia sp. LP003]